MADPARVRSAERGAGYAPAVTLRGAPAYAPSPATEFGAVTDAWPPARGSVATESPPPEQARSRAARGEREPRPPAAARFADEPEDPGGAPVGAPPDALAWLYHTHRLSLVRLAVLLVDDLETAEEVVQDVFTAACRRHGNRLADLDDPVAYVRRGVVNRARSILRRRRIARAWIAPHEPPAPSPEEAALRADEDVRLRGALRRLKPRQREVLVLRYYGNLSEAEIAATLGIAPGTVKSTASRALTALQRMLEDRP